MARGRFITFEGGEGSGKSTQAQRLAVFLRDTGLDVLTTREPGGTPLAERIRALVLAQDARASGALAEALLFYAARADHLDRLIRPALKQGTWVICDRFADSTRAYQGAAGQLPAATLEALDELVVSTTQPDLTILLDLDAQKGLQRVRERRVATAPLSATAPAEDSFEARDLAFHDALRRGYLTIAAAEPGRVVLVDAAGSVESIEHRIRDAVTARLRPPGAI